jgi:HTH-type transcriptional repressor of NAD biosynthesis genes
LIRGLVIGKFLPPHLGHAALIKFAAARCDQLTIIVCHNERYPISGSLRQRWLSEMHPSANVLLVFERCADDDSEGWATHTIEVLGQAPDRVFTSESYGELYAKYLGCEHVAFDYDRKSVEISGTKVRSNPFKYWSYLHPVVRAHFVKRIALVGAESCGKTTLAQALGETLKTYVVPEFGRFYWDAKKSAQDDPIWTTEEFVHIAQMQNVCEDFAARRANKLLICDTNSFLTSVWHRRYLNFYSSEVDELSKDRTYDMVLFCPATIPFVQDGTRDGELIRPMMSDWIKDRLDEWSIPYMILQGSLESRLELVLDKIKSVYQLDSLAK